MAFCLVLAFGSPIFCFFFWLFLISHQCWFSQLLHNTHLFLSAGCCMHKMLYFRELRLIACLGNCILCSLWLKVALGVIHVLPERDFKGHLSMVTPHLLLNRKDSWKLLDRLTNYLIWPTCGSKNNCSLKKYTSHIALFTCRIICHQLKHIPSY